MTAFTYFPDYSGWLVIHLRPEPRIADMVDSVKLAAVLDLAARSLSYFME
jgi:hypothetical protein